MKEQDNYIKKLTELRGYIIQETIRIEAIIDSILIAYYTDNNKNKKKEFHEDIISKLIFNEKKRLIKVVLSKLDPTESKIKDVIADLKYIQELRNKVAHWNWLSISNEEILLGKTDYIQFSVDQATIEKFNLAKVRAISYLSKIFFKHYNPFTPDSPQNP